MCPKKPRFCMRHSKWFHEGSHDKLLREQVVERTTNIWEPNRDPKKPKITLFLSKKHRQRVMSLRDLKGTSLLVLCFFFKINRSGWLLTHFLYRTSKLVSLCGTYFIHGMNKRTGSSRSGLLMLPPLQRLLPWWKFSKPSNMNRVWW